MSFLTALLGLDAQHNAGVAQQQSLSQQQLSNQYGAQAAGQYNQIGQQGQAQASAYQGNYLNLLNRFGATAGLGNTVGGATNQRQPSPEQSQGNLAGNLNQSLYPGSTFGGGGAAQQNDPNNPYTLDQYQSQQLNQSMAGIAQAQESAVSTFKQEMANRGLTDPRALQVGQEQIAGHFADLQAETQTKFYEQVKTDKEKALQEILQSLQSYGTQGIQEQEAAAGGIAGLGGAAQSAQGQAAQLSLQQQQLANQQIGGLLNLIGFGVGGGFGGAGGGGAAAAPIDPSSNLTGLLG